MLLRPFEETGTELLVALCNQIALMSQLEMNRETLIKEQVRAATVSWSAKAGSCSPHARERLLASGAAAPDRVTPI